MRFPKEYANYKDNSKTNKCKDCKYYIQPRACELVKGKINSQGTCDFWTPTWHKQE